jgi:methyl-accepting chemotaxis protein
MFRFATRSLVGRLQLLGGVCLAMTAALCAVLLVHLWSEREITLAETAGLPAAAAWVKLAKVTAEHRGLSAGYLGGNEDFRSKREAKHKDVDDAVRAALLAVRGMDSPRLVQLSQGLEQDWQALATAVAGKSLPGKDSFKRHNALVQRQLGVLDEVLAVSGLALEADAANYHLVMATLEQVPHLSEWLGQLRGFGAGMLAKPAFEPQDKAFVQQVLVSTVQGAEQMQVQLQRASQARPGLSAALAAPLEKAQAALTQSAAVVRKEILEAEAPAMKRGEYFAQLTQAIEGQQALAAAAFNQLESAMTARARTQGLGAAAVAGVGLVLLLGNLWLVLGMVRSIRRSSQQALAVAAAMAQGDLSTQVTGQGQGEDEFAQIVRALNDARDGISRAIAQVRDGVETIATASQEISQGSTDLSQRTEQQASSLQQTAASMEELTGTVQQSSESARQASQLATAASTAAEQGGLVMHQVVGTMGEIAASSQKISNIIGVIDGIAFQTNILALNAAVEAARAGEQGRGFAVVASEVRQLAQRSAEAAREIKGMIAASTEKVASGSQLVGEAGRSITEIVSQVRRMSDLIGEMAAASQEQTQGIGQVNTAVAQLDQGTQQNSALAEQSAAAAESLREQSERLAQAVSSFRLAAV